MKKLDLKKKNDLIEFVLLGGEAVTTPTFQLGSVGSTPGGYIFIKPLRMCVSEVFSLGTFLRIYLHKKIKKYIF